MKLEYLSRYLLIQIIGLTVAVGLLVFGFLRIVSGTKMTATQRNQSTAGNAVQVGGKETITVGFALTEGATMIDFAGPWEVFQDAGGGTGPRRFRLFTVGDSRDPIRTSGGMTVVPEYAFDDAPVPQIVVVPAQQGGPKLAEWLQKAKKNRAIVMSVCTGAFELGNAGLLDGKQATTHHEFYEAFQKSFPKTTLVKGRRYVQTDSTTYTSGGLTSDIDLALHIVDKLCGPGVAVKTAEYMEYQGKGWLE